MLDLKHLPGAHPDEKVVILLRRHWITLLSLGVSFVFILLLPPTVYVVLQYLQPEFLNDQVRITLLILGLSIFFLYAWLFLYQHFLDYYLDVWIVTNKRILNIEQNGLFSRTVSELRLHRVQDVTSEVHGFLPSMLNYGHVYIQTAGEKERFEFEQVPHPNQVTKTILDLADASRKEQLQEAIEDFNLVDKEDKEFKK